MAKYIDAEALVAKFGEEADRLEVGAGDTLAGLSLADTIATEMPAADVEPVVHAHWVVDDEYLFCSHCGESYLAGDTSHEVRERLSRGEAYKRCPHCGARMDGGQSDVR